MGIGNLFGSQEPREEEYMEISSDMSSSRPEEKILIEIENMEDYNDSDRIQRKVRDGKIVFVKIKQLKEKDFKELKRAIDRIRKTCVAINGDIAGVSDEWIIVSPSIATIHREKVENSEETKTIQTTSSRNRSPESSSEGGYKSPFK